MKRLLFILFLILGHGIYYKTFSQYEDIFIPRDILQAYENNTRSWDGNPGPAYFQNQVDYEIDAEFNPETRILKGNAVINFHNNSPEDLRYILLRNYPEVFRAGAVRGRPVESEDVGLGTEITYLKINEIEINLDDPDSYLHSSLTNQVFRCLTQSKSISIIEVKWTTTLPDVTHDRYGRIGPHSFFIAYWFPQIAMYDDINGWDFFDWNNLSEMYNEYGNFDVKIKVPDNYIVLATGTLQNPAEILAKKVFDRYEKSKLSKNPVEIISKKDLRKENRITRQGKNTWYYRAKNVNDFAFGVSKEHLWTASSLPINDNNVHIHTTRLPDSKNFREVPQITPWTIKQLSEDLPGISFPYPSMTVFNGKSGMEFPMICNNRESENIEGTYFLTVHEVAHTYLPFMVGVNQKRHGWIDEGLITMIGVEIHTKKVDDFNFRDIYLQYYPSVAGTQRDIPSIVNSVFLPESLFQEHDYMRPSLAFWILKDILGEELFRNCLQEFIKRWEGKHPTPYDLFFTFNDVTGENLNWFFQPWFIDFAWPDIAIEQTSVSGNYIEIKLNNKGGMPFPSELEIFYSDGETDTYPVDAWVWSESENYILKIVTNKSPVKCVLQTDNYPDTDAGNNEHNFE